MNQRQRKQFGSAGNLTIKGTGYTGLDNAPCHRLQNALLPAPAAAAVPKGATRRATSTATVATSTLRKTGSIGNIRSLASSSQPVVKTLSKGISTCPCRHNDFEQSAHLQEQYTRNLQQQIYLLELENNYLKHGTGKVSRNGAEVDDMHHGAVPSPPSPSTNPNTPEDRKSFRAGLPDDDKEKPTRARKRVSYAEPEVTGTPPGPSNAHDRKPPSYMTGQAELLQKLEESYQRERKLEERLKQKTTEIERIAYENSELLERIEELEGKSQKTEDNFARDKRALMEEAVELQRRLDYLTPALADKESHIAKLETEKDELGDKLRNATNQLNEIQMMMDEKSREEKALCDVEGDRKNEVDRLLRTNRRLENLVEELKNKEVTLIDEIAAMKRSLREEQLTAKKDKAVAEKALEENSVLIKENSHLSAQLSRLEMRVKTLTQELDNARANEIRPEEVAELRDGEKLLKAELMKMQERLQTEKERGRHANAELEQYQKAEEGARESRARMQKELGALKALSESLSNENKSLRQEKFALGERCEELFRKGNLLTDEVTNLTNDVDTLKETNADLQERVNEKAKEMSTMKEEMGNLMGENRELLRKLENQENDLQVYKEKYQNAERKCRDMDDQLDKQTAMQQEKAEEYEKLAKRVLELSDSLKKERKPSSSSSTAARLSRLPTPPSEKSPDKQAKS